MTYLSLLSSRRLFMICNVFCHAYYYRNYFHFSRYFTPSPQTGQRFPPCHRDPRPFETRYDSQTRSLACNLFGGPQDSSYYGPQFDQSHGNHRDQKFPGNHRHEKNTTHGGAEIGELQILPGGHHHEKDIGLHSSKSKNHYKGNRGQRSSDRSQRSSSQSTDETSTESSTKLKKDSKNSQNHERKVQYSKDSLGSEFFNLKITVTEKAKPPQTAIFPKSKKGELIIGSYVKKSPGAVYSIVPDSFYRFKDSVVF